MKYLEALNWRYAVKAFSDKTLDAHHIDGLIESTRLSASAFGLQPYKLIVISNDALKRDLLPFCYGQEKVAECSHLLILANKTYITEKDITFYIDELAATQGSQRSQLQGYEDIISQNILAMNQSQQAAWAQQQCYLALGNILSYAALNKFDACPMTGFDSTAINQVLDLNLQGLNAAIMCPVGYRSKTDHTANRPKYRKPTEQMVITL